MRHRTFIAVNLPEEIKDSIIELLACLKKVNPGREIRWVRPEGIHLTLHFLGYLEEEKLEKVKEILRNRAGEASSFELVFGGIGAFPSLSRPRVIFLECQEVGDGILVTLQKDLGKDLEKLGVEIDRRPWHPHITLGRVKFKCELRGVDSKVPDLRFKVSSIELMESQLRPDGARYSALESFKLKP